MTRCIPISVAFLVRILIAIVSLSILPARISAQTTLYKIKVDEGVPVTMEHFLQILQKHERWLSTGGKEGARADLRRTDLTGLRLFYAEENFLFLVNKEVNLSKAILNDINLSGVFMPFATFNEALLQNAKLIGTRFGVHGKIDTTLNPVIPISGTYAPPGGRVGGGRYFSANFSGADLSFADLSHAVLSGVNLSGADLSFTKLSEATLDDVNLSGAYIMEAEMSNVSMGNTNLDSTIFEPKLDSLPSIFELALAKNLYKLKYKKTPAALVKLRKDLKKAGMRKQEREITYAIRHTERLQLWGKGLKGKLESAFQWILFEITCAYGMSHGRPLRIMGILMLLFSFPYMFALKRPSRGRAGIWAVWLSDRILIDEGKDKPVRVTLEFPFPKLQAQFTGKWWGALLRYLCVPLMGFYFSLLSAVHIGWRDLNVGRWITRMQPREYDLRGTGWVRVLSGFQSLISIYLLALWVLAYFGRPFE